MRALLLVILVGCRGSSGAPSAGSGSSVERARDAQATRAVACAPAKAKVSLAAHEELPVACWDTTCVRDGERLAAKPTRPPAWLKTAEVRMENGVLSVCNDGCQPINTRTATLIAATDPAKVSATQDLTLVVIDTHVWRVRFDTPLELAPPSELFGRDSTEKPSRVVVAGDRLIATFDKHGQLFDQGGTATGDALHDWDPGDVIQLDAHTFIVTDRSAPRIGAFDIATGNALWEHDALAGFSIEDTIRIHDGIAAILLHDDTGWWIATIAASERKIIALEQLPACR